ncbi:hypothetical protein GCM10011515_27070 [Tsuneonella deserti]|uniref:Uncharacterized protein n=1 Tax=Tsuneonella deserti TaxID=2035528 RepID=A0ABQ1SEP7_9SPHN|nr:hypothetical protein GCM10011515_27070 [Tsuneonella deserti]
MGADDVRQGHQTLGLELGKRDTQIPAVFLREGLEELIAKVTGQAIRTAFGHVLAQRLGKLA